MMTHSSSARCRLPIVLIGCLAMALLCGSSFVQAQDGGPGGDNEMPRYWEVHALLLTLGTTFVVMGYLSLWMKSIGRLESLGVPVHLGKKLARFWFRWRTA